MNTRPGFTAIEVLVTVCVIGMLFFASIPALSNMGQTFALKGAAREIVSDLRLAQEKAVSNKATVSVEFIPKSLFGDPATYLVKIESRSAKGAKQIKAQRLSRKFDFISQRTLKFSSSGFPPAGGSGTVVLTDAGGRTKSVILSSAGRVRME